MEKTPSPNKELKNINLKRGLSRSGSVRSKGIGLNLAVSPISNESITPQRSRSSTLPPVNEDLTKENTIPQEHDENYNDSDHRRYKRSLENKKMDLKYDFTLPPMEEIKNLEFEQQLRLMALKEMSIVELKDNINNLNQKLSDHERDLHKLRELIQRSLYNELQTSNNHLSSQNPTSLSRESANNRLRGDSNPRDEANNHRRMSGDKSIWSSLSRPLTLIQQLDTMLQNEFEKSLIPDRERDHDRKLDKERERQEKSLNLHQINETETDLPKINSQRSSTDEYSLISSNSPLKDKSNNDNINLDDLIEETYKPRYKYDRNETPTTDKERDMLTSVSSSIWSFVNDVKSNVMSSMNDERDLYNLDNGSNISLNDNTIINDDEFNKILDLKKNA